MKEEDKKQLANLLNMMNSAHGILIAEENVVSMEDTETEMNLKKQIIISVQSL